MTHAFAPAVLDVATMAQLACLLEVSAPKPGNVSPGRDFGDLCYADFLASAAAIGPSLAVVGEQPLGSTIRHAVQATLAWTRSNSNLGIILLLAPLARAAVGPAPAGLREALRLVLHSTTIEDAREVYTAIRAAAPGGLGTVEAEDVADEPARTLFEVMQLAADRDGIAREYATAFKATFEIGAPALTRGRDEGLSWPDSVVETYLVLLADSLDTHIVRRAGATAAEEVSRMARSVLAAGGVRSEAGRQALDLMHLQLRTGDHLLNPGTSADLTAAAIFVVLLKGGWFIQGGGHAKSR